MDDKNRTCCRPFEIPDDVLPLLRRAADLGLELACDFGDWSDDVRAQVINAARVVDVFYLGTPSTCRVAELADTALR